MKQNVSPKDPYKTSKKENCHTRSSDTIDNLIKEIADTKDWSKLVPDYDEDALMVHWTSKS